ncbi:uncharacterized protein MYCGRDRAFT_95081 [Zymoseptoria tritici IPO323]|uniref:Uncharacterized protein n=1 Tax=Zymoseptoria tritici (strain CBS 115943 / IPO323) TaxID=336722 RepID=F9XH90_ZYMTI|nr:uncharacterized protein MYCGRDRAFT_95081 [Zymoseptoria tritici IPO323]EGP84966.1 hypothetical protein MYCGRDRAFT_95081 [Zymoseptoria tritici IPO323]
MATTYSCTVCSFTTQDVNEINTHTTDSNASRELFKCPGATCSALFCLPTQAEAHFKHCASMYTWKAKKKYGILLSEPRVKAACEQDRAGQVATSTRVTGTTAAPAAIAAPATAAAPPQPAAPAAATTSSQPTDSNNTRWHGRQGTKRRGRQTRDEEDREEEEEHGGLSDAKVQVQDFTPRTRAPVGRGPTTRGRSDVDARDAEFGGVMEGFAGLRQTITQQLYGAGAVDMDRVQAETDQLREESARLNARIAAAQANDPMEVGDDHEQDVGNEDEDLDEGDAIAQTARDLPFPGPGYHRELVDGQETLVDPDGGYIDKAGNFHPPRGGL